MIQLKDTRSLEVLIHQFFYWDRILGRFEGYSTFGFPRLSRIDLCVNGPPNLTILLLLLSYYYTYYANDMKIFILLSESPLKVRKIAVDCFLILFLVPELLRSKDLKNYRKNGTKNARS